MAKIRTANNPLLNNGFGFHKTNRFTAVRNAINDALDIK